MGNIAAVVAATAEEQLLPHHPRCVYHRTAVPQSTAEEPIHQQPTIPPCLYNNSAALQQKKKKKRKRRDKRDSTDALFVQNRALYR